MKKKYIYYCCWLTVAVNILAGLKGKVRSLTFSIGWRSNKVVRYAYVSLFYITLHTIINIILISLIFFCLKMFYYINLIALILNQRLALPSFPPSSHSLPQDISFDRFGSLVCSIEAD